MAASKLLSDSGWRGGGFLRYDPIQRERQAQRFSAEAEIRHFLPDPARGGQINPSQQLPRDALSVAGNTGHFQAEPRRVAKLCVPVSVHEDFTRRFAQGFHVVNLPADFIRECPGRFHFEAH